MKKLILAGGGGFGREVLTWARQCKEWQKEWEIGGFLDDDSTCLAGYDPGIPLLGTIADWSPAADEIYLCTIGQPALKRKCVDHLLAKEATFTRLIHPTAIVGERVELGVGVILCPGVVLTCDLEIGAHTALNVGSSVGHDAYIGPYGQLQSRTAINGYVKIGEQALFGTGSSILPEKRIGDRCIIGAGSVVMSNVPDDVTVHGNPAKIIYSKRDS